MGEMVGASTGDKVGEDVDCRFGEFVGPKVTGGPDGELVGLCVVGAIVGAAVGEEDEVGLPVG